jgi:FkbM family methyltransferase
MVQRILRTFGWEIRRFIESEVTQLSKQLNQRSINIVLDIGANEGQFASALFLAGYKGRIISFDPLSDVHKKLKNNAASNPNWVVAEATAIGSEDGFTEINVSKNLVRHLYHQRRCGSRVRCPGVSCCTIRSHTEDLRIHHQVLRTVFL